jgi:hypothetical protein
MNKRKSFVILVVTLLLGTFVLSAATPALAATCSGPSTMTGYYSGGRRYTNPVTVTCTGTVSRIRVWGELRIKGVVKDTKDVTCRNTTSCTMPSMSAVAGQYDPWTSQYWWNATP